MAWTDVVGVAGVLLILAAYAGGIVGKLHPQQALSLLANLAGASMILLSLWRDFNLSAALMEGAWALFALGGLVRLLIVRPPPDDAR